MGSLLLIKKIAGPIRWAGAQLSSDDQRSAPAMTK
jgi:hypothetical protein